MWPVCVLKKCIYERAEQRTCFLTGVMFISGGNVGYLDKKDATLFLIFPFIPHESLNIPPDSGRNESYDI